MVKGPIGPALVAGTALAFVSAIGNFGIAALLGIPAAHTLLPVLIYQRLASFGPTVIAEVAVLSVLIGVIAFAGVLAQGWLLRRRDDFTAAFAANDQSAAGALLALLLVLWPPVVEEVLIEQADEGRSGRLLVSAGQAPMADTIARDRPISLWRLETRSGEVVHAWLGGVRDQDSGALRSDLPDWLRLVRIDPPWPDGVDLVLVGADQQSFELAISSLQRMYRPNALNFVQRLALARDRFIERWRWPFSATDGG